MKIDLLVVLVLSDCQRAAQPHREVTPRPLWLHRPVGSHDAR